MIAKVPLMENLLREENLCLFSPRAVPLVKPGSPGSAAAASGLPCGEESALETANFLAMAVVSPRALGLTPLHAAVQTCVVPALDPQ